MSKRTEELKIRISPEDKDRINSKWRTPAF